MYNSLDALCKRFKISLAEREKHGALIDTRLLASVYLELQGGKARSLDLAMRTDGSASRSITFPTGYAPRERPLPPRSSPAERERHAQFVAEVIKNKSLWRTLGVDIDQAAALAS